MRFAIDTITAYTSAFCISETCYRYQPINDNENAQIANLLADLTVKETDWGFGQCFHYLRIVKDFGLVTATSWQWRF